MASDYWAWHRRLGMICTAFVLPLLIAGYGVYCLWHGEARFPTMDGGANQGDWIPLPSKAVPSLASAAIALGLLLHIHFFWNSQRALRAGRFFEFILGAIFLSCFACAFYRAIAPF